MTNQEQKSDCCNSSFYSSCADEGTCCYICEKCQKACDPVNIIKEENPCEGGINILDTVIKSIRRKIACNHPINENGDCFICIGAIKE